jgi:hypothetical protein
MMGSVEARHACTASGLNNAIKSLLAVVALRLIVLDPPTTDTTGYWKLPPAAISALLYWQISDFVRDNVVLQVHNEAPNGGSQTGARGPLSWTAEDQ